MANFTIDPKTGIKIPTVGVDPGTDYATNISAALTKLSSLTHTGASNSDGDQIPAAGLNINADLSIQSHNLTDIKSTRMTDQTLVLSGAGDVNCFYSVNGNAYFNNGSGTPVQLTAGNVVEVIASNNFTLTTKTANFTINASDGYAIFDINSAGTVLATLPLAANVPAGRMYFFKDISGHADVNVITIARAGADTIDGSVSKTIQSKYGATMLVSDGVASWQEFKFATKQYTSGDAINVNTGATLTIGGTETIASGGLLTVASGGAFTLQAGSTNTLTGATVTGGTLSGPTLSGPTLSGTMTGGTLSGTTLSSPTLFGTMTGGFIHNMDLTMNSTHIMNLDTGSVITRGGDNLLVLISSGYTRLATSFSTSSATYVDATGLSVTLTCTAGDVLMIDTKLVIFNASFTGLAKTIIVDGGSPVDPGEIVTNGATGVRDSHTNSFKYTVVNTGTITVKAQANAVNGGTTTLSGDNGNVGSSSIRVQQFRP